MSPPPSRSAPTPTPSRVTAKPVAPRPTVTRPTVAPRPTSTTPGKGSPRTSRPTTPRPTPTRPTVTPKPTNPAHRLIGRQRWTAPTIRPTPTTPTVAPRPTPTRPTLVQPTITTRPTSTRPTSTSPTYANFIQFRNERGQADPNFHNVRTRMVQDILAGRSSISDAMGSGYFYGGRDAGGRAADPLLRVFGSRTPGYGSINTYQNRRPTASRTGTTPTRGAPTPGQTAPLDFGDTPEALGQGDMQQLIQTLMQRPDAQEIIQSRSLPEIIDMIQAPAYSQQGVDAPVAGDLPTMDMFSEDATRQEQATFDRLMNLVNPGMEQARNALTRDLENRGIPMGSPAWVQAQQNLAQRQAQQQEDIGLSAVGAGRAEHSRLMDLARAMQGQRFGQDLATAQFTQSDLQRLDDAAFRDAAFRQSEANRVFGQRAAREGMGMDRDRFAASEQGRMFGQDLARNQLALQALGQMFGQSQAARQQGISEMLLERQMPYQEYQAMRQNTFIPNFINFPTAPAFAFNAPNYMQPAMNYQARQEANRGFDWMGLARTMGPMAMNALIPGAP